MVAEFYGGSPNGGACTAGSFLLSLQLYISRTYYTYIHILCRTCPCVSLSNSKDILNVLHMPGRKVVNRI